MTSAGTERLVVGLVRGIHGLRGAVRVEILTDDPERFRPGSLLHAEGDDAPLTVTWVQPDGPGLLVRFREVPTREAADLLRDRYLEADIPVDALPDGSFYWHEIVGTPVRTTDGRDLGSVVDIFRAGGSEVFVVRGGAHGEVMIPAVGAVIRELAPREGRIVVDADALGLDEVAPQRRARGRRTANASRRGDPARDTGTGAPAEGAATTAPDAADVAVPSAGAGDGTAAP
ncbi:MAG: ribosome maturation factor RimM [Chloroflexota bacterium]